MESLEVNGNRSPVILGIGGIGSKFASTLSNMKGLDVILIDTDRRSFENLEDRNFLLVGKDIVNGEGTGDNLNTAKACFKTSMDRIAPEILSRPLVMTISSVDGATGIAGSVEIVQFLSKVGLPTFSLMVDRSDHGLNGQGKKNISQVLLTGPLKPGSRVDLQDDDIRPIQQMVVDICMGSVQGIDFPVPSASWSYLRENDGSFEINHFEDADLAGKSIFHPPGILIIRMPRTVSVEDLKKKIDDMVVSTEGIGIGIIADDGAERISLTSIQPSTEKPPSSPGSAPDPEILKGIIDQELDTEMGPRQML